MKQLSIIQGFYFFLIGVWPLLSIRTFQMVTGPKTDLWLVKTVGALVAVIGGLLIIAGLRGNVSSEILLLAVGSAFVLTIVDINYAAKGTISRIYLVDAVAEI